MKISCIRKRCKKKITYDIGTFLWIPLENPTDGRNGKALDLNFRVGKYEILPYFPIIFYVKCNAIH